MAKHVVFKVIENKVVYFKKTESFEKIESVVWTEKKQEACCFTDRKAAISFMEEHKARKPYYVVKVPEGKSAMDLEKAAARVIMAAEERER